MLNSQVRQSAYFGMELEPGAQLVDFTNNTLVVKVNGPISIGANSAGLLGEGVYLLSETVDHDVTWLAHDAPHILEDGD